ncbi:MAG: hypothetical protein HC905_03725 [Bacteroidales bacterium]|nr:hypothetical protein [Bacteroidales bacterium]
MEPGDKVIIREGIYRETVHPAKGGVSAEKMITYEAAVGEKVIISGSFPLETKNGKKEEDGFMINMNPILKTVLLRLPEYGNTILTAKNLEDTIPLDGKSDARQGVFTI